MSNLVTVFNISGILKKRNLDDQLSDCLNPQKSTIVIRFKPDDFDKQKCKGDPTRNRQVDTTAYRDMRHTLTHFTVSLNAARFEFSQNFGTLLVSQSDVTPEKKPVDTNRKFTYLKKTTNWFIPITYYHGNELYREAKLQINENASITNSLTDEYREEFARTAHLTSYSLYFIDNIKLNGSHWQPFYRELIKDRYDNPTTMWWKGFNILQNIENKEMIESSRKIEDEISDKIKNRYARPRPTHEGTSNKKAEQKDQ